MTSLQQEHNIYALFENEFEFVSPFNPFNVTFLFRNDKWFRISKMKRDIGFVINLDTSNKI